MESSATTPNSRVNVASGYGVVAVVTVVKTWTLDCGLDYKLDHGWDFGLNLRPEM